MSRSLFLIVAGRMESYTSGVGRMLDFTFSALSGYALYLKTYDLRDFDRIFADFNRTVTGF